MSNNQTAHKHTEISAAPACDEEIVNLKNEY